MRDPNNEMTTGPNNRKSKILWCLLLVVEDVYLEHKLFRHARTMNKTPQCIDISLSLMHYHESSMFMDPQNLGANSS